METVNWARFREAYPDMVEFIESIHGTQPDEINAEDAKIFWDEWDAELESRVEE